MSVSLTVVRSLTRIRAKLSWTTSRFVLLFCAAALFFGACSVDDTFLPALLADPMARYEANGIELIESEERSRGRDLVTRKPVTAQVRMIFRLEDPAQMEQVFLDAIVAAEAAGWDLGEMGALEDEFGGKGIAASKEFDWGSGRLTIVVGPTPRESDGDVLLQINLDE